MHRIPFYYLVMIIISFIMFLRYRFLIRQSKVDLQNLRDFDVFLSRFYNHYSIYEDIEEGFSSTLDDTKGDCFIHMDEIYQLLQRDEEEDIRQYKWNGAPSCFITFLHLCYCMNCYGGGAKNTNRAFLIGLTHLKRQVCFEIMKREKLSSEFMGIIPMILFPSVFLYAIRCWSTWNLKELSSYYDGFYGKISVTLILFVVVISYEIILHMRDDFGRLCTSSIIYSYLSRFEKVTQKIEYILYQYPDYVYKIENQLRKALVTWNVPMHCFQKVLYGAVLGVVMCFLFYPIGNGNLFEEVMKFVIALMLIFSAYRYPDFRLKLLAYKKLEERDNEMMRFLSIFQILSQTKTADVLYLLEEFASGSILYEISIQNCIDAYPYQFEEAIDELKETEAFELFEKILDALILSERTGLMKTFEPLKQEQSIYLEQKKQGDEIKIENKGALAKCIAFIPLVLTIGFYLVIPFVLESLVQLKGFMDQINTLS